MRVPRHTLAACLLVAVLTACAGGAAEHRTTAVATGGGVAGELTVFAAASLTDAFDEMAAAFGDANPGVTDVTLNYAGSQQLAAQIANGAPADVFASASGGHMDAVAAQGLLQGEPHSFAGNLLQIAVEPGNPLGIRGLVDLGKPDYKVVLAAEEVPAGRYARQALARAGLQVQPVSLETDVRAVLSKVSLGEADAGIVYVSDVTGAGDAVEGVRIPDRQNVRATYPVAALTRAPNPDAARAFVDFVRSAEGVGILVDHGFTRP
ncbi:MAG: molybdate ABC transporter substrate-binding protein [Egibacteraceae bacterium]